MTPLEHPPRVVDISTQTAARQIDEAVAHVFEIMLCHPCTLVDRTPNESPAAARRTGPGISATVLISGAFQGRFEVDLSTPCATNFTAILLGPDTTWERSNTDEAVIDDAVRELCNMIAGGWKSRLGALASACQISVPALSHSAPQTHTDGPTNLRRVYAFAGSLLEVTPP